MNCAQQCLSLARSSGRWSEARFCGWPRFCAAIPGARRQDFPVTVGSGDFVKFPMKTCQSSLQVQLRARPVTEHRGPRTDSLIYISETREIREEKSATHV